MASGHGPPNGVVVKTFLLEKGRMCAILTSDAGEGPSATKVKLPEIRKPPKILETAIGNILARRHLQHFKSLKMLNVLKFRIRAS